MRRLTSEYEGGIIALNIGVQGIGAAENLKRIDSVFKKGLVNYRGAKTAVVQWIPRWLFGSIYVGSFFGLALQEHFIRQSQRKMFGIQRHCRVAVTTTVEKTYHLIANYNRGSSRDAQQGDPEKYMDSLGDLWDM